MKSKKERYNRNRVIKKHYGLVSIEGFTEEDKDSMYATINALNNCEVPLNYVSSFVLDTPVSYPKLTTGCNVTTQETIDMDINTYKTERNHLDSALYNALHVNEAKLEEHFNIRGKKPIHTKQAVEWIKADKFRYDDEETAGDPNASRFNIFEGISFTDGEPDHVGYNAAYKKMREDFEKIMLRNKINDPKDTLKEVESFKTRTYH